jgi:hypothetical protein
MGGIAQANAEGRRKASLRASAETSAASALRIGALFGSALPRRAFQSKLPKLPQPATARSRAFV